jgi:CrcB protein
VTWVYVALGAAVGAPLRYVVGHLLDGGLARGTVLVNWVGSLLLGWFSGLGLTGDAVALLGTGFCGALTTYSSFAVHTHDRGPRLGTLNVLVTLVPALLLCGLGFWVGAR